VGVGFDSVEQDQDALLRVQLRVATRFAIEFHGDASDARQMRACVGLGVETAETEAALEGANGERVLADEV